EAAPEKLRAAQRNWIALRNGCGETEDTIGAVDCAAEAYRDRITVLNAVYGLEPGGAYPVGYTVAQFADVPPAVMAAVEALESCALDIVSEGAEVFDRDLGYALWVVPCWAAAYNFGYAAVAVPNDAPEAARALAFSPPPDAGWNAGYSITLPNVELTTGEIVGFHKARGISDCGTFEAHVWDGRDRMTLVEYREKNDCDGVFTEPSDYPLVYRAW
ncbi:MAG: DUF1176 domain-containing protein, partial [Pseudomonadota bacterium]